MAPRHALHHARHAAAAGGAVGALLGRGLGPMGRQRAGFDDSTAAVYVHVVWGWEVEGDDATRLRLRLTPDWCLCLYTHTPNPKLNSVARADLAALLGGSGLDALHLPQHGRPRVSSFFYDRPTLSDTAHQPSPVSRIHAVRCSSSPWGPRALRCSWRRWRWGRTSSSWPWPSSATSSWARGCVRARLRATTVHLPFFLIQPEPPTHTPDDRHGRRSS